MLGGGRWEEAIAQELTAPIGSGWHQVDALSGSASEHAAACRHITSKESTKVQGAWCISKTKHCHRASRLAESSTMVDLEVYAFHRALGSLASGTCVGEFLVGAP